MNKNIVIGCVVVFLISGALGSCPVGTYVVGSTCISCPLGFYSDEINSESCKTCGNLLTTYNTGATSKLDCKCDASSFPSNAVINLYMLPNGSLTCTTCPKNAICSNGTMVAEAGYFISSKNPLSVIPCPYPDACPGGAWDECSEGFNPSTTCTTCDHRHYLVGGACRDCHSYSPLLFFLYLIFLIVFILTLYKLSRAKYSWNFLGTFTITFVLFQVLGLYSQFGLQWPDSLLVLFRIFAFFGLNVDVTAPSCIGAFSYVARFCIVILLPMWSYIILIITCAILYFIRNVKSEQRIAMLNRVLYAAGAFLMIAYLPLSHRALQVYDCKPQQVGSNIFSVMTSETSIQCYTSSEWKRFSAASGFFIFLYVALIPVMSAAVLAYAKWKNLFEDKNFSAKFGFLYEAYRKEIFWWEMVSYLYKFFCVVVVTFISDPKTKAGSIGAVLCVVFLCQIMLKPYKRITESYSFGCLIILQSLIAFLGIMFDTAEQYYVVVEVFEWMLLAMVVCCVGGIVYWSIVQFRKPEKIKKVPSKTAKPTRVASKRVTDTTDQLKLVDPDNVSASPPTEKELEKKDKASVIDKFTAPVRALSQTRIRKNYSKVDTEDNKDDQPPVT